MSNNENEIRDQLNNSTVHKKEISNELKTSFLEYAMSVIVARALPDAKDGFKPVHRRVLYAASTLGMTSGSQYKKSARLVGEVIGKYHPHGDTAVYETMVRLAQDFSMRYQLIDGHGNFGSVDGDSPAAMRYTEARLSKIADTILDDINKDTVDFVDNYDGSEKEPVVLPCLFPNMLANGASGIAVGMATNIPPHNLNELVDAITLLARNPEATVDDIIQVLKGPDFPTGAQIIGATGIKNYFATGKGSVTVRAKVDIEQTANGKPVLIVREIPYVVNKTNLLERITELVKDKKIEGITDLRDESNREGIRIVIELNHAAIPELVLNKLYKETQLQTNFSVNMLALVNGEPRVLNIKQAIQVYLQHQIDVLVRKTKFELKKAQDRLHILQGFQIAAQHIDEIIKMIRQSNDDELLVQEMMRKFGLSLIQTRAILEMRLKALSAIEQSKVVAEIQELEILIKDLSETLRDSNKQISIIIDNLNKLVIKFGDKRRTEILYGACGSIDDEDLIKQEDILITLSTNGYIKRLPIDTYRVQKRGGVGVIGLNTNSDDDVYEIVVAHTHCDILFFTSYGKIYRLRGHQIPLGSRQAKGVPAINFLPIDKQERIVSVLPIKEYKDGFYLIFVTVNGIIKKTPITEYQSIFKNGKIALGLKDDDKLFDVKLVTDKEEIFVASSSGRLVRFNGKDVRPMGRSACGVKAISLEKKACVVGFSTSSSGDKILSIGSKGIGKISPANLYRLTKRGSKGVTTLKITPKTGDLAATMNVFGNEDVLIITTSNKVIRFSLNNFHESNRNTQGVKLIELNDNDRIIAAAVFDQTINGDHDANSSEQQNDQEQ